MTDPALAELYYRSAWTQEELAKVEGCSNRIMAYRLTFGRFLAFATGGSNPRNLCERTFRKYWERTDKANGNERQRAIPARVGPTFRCSKLSR